MGLTYGLQNWVYRGCTSVTLGVYKHLQHCKVGESCEVECTCIYSSLQLTPPLNNANEFCVCSPSHKLHDMEICCPVATILIELLQGWSPHDDAKAIEEVFIEEGI